MTILSESGVPTPVVHTKMRPPRSRMGSTDDVESAAKASPLMRSTGLEPMLRARRELLADRLDQAAEPDAPAKEAHRKKAAKASQDSGALGDFLKSSTGKQVQREVIRGVFGLLKRRI